MTPWLLFLVLFLLKSLSAQQRFVNLDLNSDEALNWNISAVTLGTYSSCPNDPGNNTCFKVHESGYAIRTLSTIGYQSINQCIDINAIDLSWGGRCIVEYTTAALSGYVTLISALSGGTNIEMSFPDNADINDRDDLTIRLRNSASGTGNKNNCYFDELELWGVEVPTTAPTRSPSLSPTPSPSVMPSVAPSRLPTSMPTATPSTSPTVQPTVNPTARPTGDMNDVVLVVTPQPTADHEGQATDGPDKLSCMKL